MKVFVIIGGGNIDSVWDIRGKAKLRLKELSNRWDKYLKDYWKIEKWRITRKKT